jgi:hypothetical protein
LAWCAPLYFGCPNAGDYLPAGSWIELPLLDAEVAANRLSAMLDNPNDYATRLPAIAAARHRYLDDLQFFANIADIVRQLGDSPEPLASVRLYPDGGVPLPSSPPAPRELQRKLAGALRLTGWRLLEWADDLRPLPAPSPSGQEGPALPTLRRVAEESWAKLHGERTMRLEYVIAPGETVVDVGGFEGEWVSDLFSRYLCTVHVFEAVSEAAKATQRRFSGNPHVVVHRFTLGGSTDALLVPGATQGTPPRHKRRFSDVANEQGWSEIALMKVNVGGGEYELLEHLIDSGTLSLVRNLQVKFDDSFPGARERMLAIQSRLSATHQLTYYFPFVWENWQRKDPAP